MDEFLKRSLSAYHDDLVYARRGGFLSREQVDFFQQEYCTIADSIQDAKREQRKQDNIHKNKKSLASIHKIHLPQLRDSLYGGPWIEQVDYISKALTEQEHESPFVKQKVLDLVRDSLKSATGSLKALKKTVEGWNELENVIEKIKEMLGNQFVVMEDLQQRLKAMKVPRT